VEAGDGVIMVGDELKAYVVGYLVQCVEEWDWWGFSDYHGANSAGLEARLIRRKGEWSDGAVRNSEEDLSGVESIKDINELVEEVKRRNQSM